MRRFLLLALMLILPGVARAETVQDEQIWLNATVMGGLGGDAVFFAEVQPRFDDGASRLGQLLLRPAIGIKLSRAVTLYQGYAHVVLPVDGGRDRNEERSFQQLSWTISPSLSSRTRLEQRWLSNGDDTGWRVREMVRFETPLGADKAGIAALGSVEGFFALNDTDWGARSGFDQVRVFAGLEIPLEGASTVEAGYLNQTVNAAGGVIRMNHIASISMFLRF